MQEILSFVTYRKFAPANGVAVASSISKLLCCYRGFPIISVRLGEGRLTSPPMVAKRPTRELVASGVRGSPAQAASVF
jgi:hypothetical protein